MKKTSLITSVVILITLFLFACKKSETLPPPLDDTPTKMVKKVTAGDNDFISYEYDAAGNVIKYVSQWENGTGSVNRQNNNFEYNGNKLTRFSNESGYSNFSYNGNRIDKSENYAINGKKLSTYQYQYDEKGRVTSVHEIIANPLSDGMGESRIDYQYYQNGNLSKIDFFYRKGANDPFVLNFSKLFVEYDNKKNPEPAAIAGYFLPGQILLKNNPLKINNLKPDGTIEGYSRYEYSYNSEGYPITRKHFIAVGSTEQAPLQFQYTY